MSPYLDSNALRLRAITIYSPGRSERIVPFTKSKSMPLVNLISLRSKSVSPTFLSSMNSKSLVLKPANSSAPVTLEGLYMNSLITRLSL